MTLKEKAYTLLRWSERYTKTDMVYLVSGGFWLSSSQVLIAVVSFLSTVALGLYLPKDAYGNYKYILSVFAVLSAFTLTGLNTAIIQSVASKYEGALRQGFRLSLKWSLFASLCALLGASYYFFKGNSFLGSSLVLIAVTIPFFFSYGLFGSFLNGKKDFKRYSVFSFIDNIVPLIVVVISIILTNNVIVVLITYFTSGVLIRALLYLWTLRVHAPKDIEDPHLQEYSIKLSALNVIGTIATHIDKILVFTSLGAVELAIYGFASTFPDRIRSLLKNLNTLMVPKFSENASRNLDTDLFQKTIYLGIFLVIVTVIYIAFAPFLYGVFFPNYPESVFYSRVLSLMILSSVAMIPLSLFIAEKKEDYYAKATIISSIFQIILLLPAVHIWGLMGVIISRIVSSYIIVGISYYLVRKRLYILK